MERVVKTKKSWSFYKKSLNNQININERPTHNDFKGLSVHPIIWGILDVFNGKINKGGQFYYFLTTSW
jgi:hypothetical protein